MATIVTRAGKGSALTHAEVDANFVNLNNAKLEGTVAIANGGTGATTATNARTNLGAAASGANSDITALSGLSGNITFTGTANRIRGDFSNADVGGRVMFQTSTTNSGTTITAIPNGTSTFAVFQARSTSSLGNSHQIAQFGVVNSGTEVRLSSDITGEISYVPMTFYTGGSERMRIDTSGNVGIGTSSTSGYRVAFKNGAKSQFFTTDASSSFYYTDGNFYFGATSADNVVAVTNNTERMRIDSSGNVGIGTSSPGGYRLNVNGSYLCSSGVDLTPGASFGTQFNINGNGYTGGIALDATGMWIGQNSGSRSLIFACGNNGSTVTERARIDSSGNLLVNSTSTSYAVSGNSLRWLNGTALMCSKNTTADTNQIAFFNPNGNVGAINSNGSSTSYLTSSDYRLKENIQPMTGALAKVALLQPRTYKWKADGSDGEGFIAHELQEVVPQCVTGEKDAVDAEGKPVYQGIDTSFLVATLTAALQEAHGLIKDLQARVDALEAK